MDRSCDSNYWIKILAIGGSIALSGECALTEPIVPDNTLGTNASTVRSDVDSQGRPSQIIEGGAVVGTNNHLLLHSFEEFHINEGQSVYFDNPATVDTILSRVTGNNPSQILGALGVLGNADLFLINPNGIIFGANASLDIQGSFLATTASSIIFDNGTQFSAVNPDAPPLLTVNVPVGLQFGENVGTIVNQSRTSLSLQPGQTLALIGGDIIMQGGILVALDGRIELGSVDRNNQVSLNKIEKGWQIGYEGVQNFRDISLSEEASIGSNGSFGSGEVHLQGRQVTLTGGSDIFATVLLSLETGGNLTIDASESVELTGRNADGSRPNALETSSFGIGDAGDIIINTKKLILRDGADILAESLAEGRGGDIIINASDSIEISDTRSLLSTESSGEGRAGNILITVENLTIRNGGQISATSQGLGSAGNINIMANSIFLNSGTIAAETRGNTAQEGANIKLQISNLLLLENESQITARAFDRANGGNININTGFLIAQEPTGLQGSNIIADAEFGNGGRIAINSNTLFGIEPRSQQTQFNDITASSRFGLSGEVIISDPNVNPQQTFEELPENIVDVSRLVAQNLCKASPGSQFTITGRGGLPHSPSEAFSSDDTWEDWRVTSQPVNQITQPRSQSYRPSKKIVEAQGWVVNSQGKIVLTAEPDVTTPHNPILSQSGCR